MILTISHLLLAVCLGLWIGYERERQQKPAGIRDITLITLGACVFTIIAFKVHQIDITRNDLGRIISYTIASIGFLGSGAIIHNKGDVEGITTASSLWSMVGTGILCAIGEISLAIITTALIYGILKIKHLQIKIEQWKIKKS